MTCIDKLKYDNFARDRDAHLKKNRSGKFRYDYKWAWGEFLKRHKKNTRQLRIPGYNITPKKKKTRLCLLPLDALGKIFTFQNNCL